MSLTDEEKELLNKYEQRESFWADKYLNQMDYSTNIFFTIGLGVLGYLVLDRKSYPPLVYIKDGVIEWNLIVYFIELFLLFSSVVVGSASIISRLYDLRITRHILWVRRIALKEHNLKIDGKYLDLSKANLFKTFLESVFSKLGFVNKPDFSNQVLVLKKYERLRYQAKCLGRFSWWSYKFQVITMLIAILIHAISIIK